MGSGKMTRHMEWDIICMQMEPPITESGKMTSNTEKGLRHGPMVQGMKGPISRVKSTGKALYVLQMEVFTQETFSSMKYQEEENMFGLMVNHMRVNGRRIKCTATESLHGKMAKGTKATL